MSDGSISTPEAAPQSARPAGRWLSAPAARIARHLRQFGTGLLDIAYPPSCLACRAATSAAATLCAQCWSAMRFIERPYCERLGTPFAQDLGPGLLSPQAMSDPPVYGRARAVARYEDGPAQKIVHRLKYSDRLELARPVGHWMARAGAELLAEADLLIPAPLHWRRLAKRRFNQAAALAQSIAAVSGQRVETSALRRVKPTRPQVGLSRVQRGQNVEGAFRVPDEMRLSVTGRRIVLVDDVLTSGATMNAAARVLLRAGAERVDVPVFARVVTTP